MIYLLVRTLSASGQTHRLWIAVNSVVAVEEFPGCSDDSRVWMTGSGIWFRVTETVDSLTGRFQKVGVIFTE